MSDESNPGTTQARLLGIIALILTFWALKAAYAVFMPVTAALFIIALVYPAYVGLQRRIPSGFALLLTFLLVLAGFAAFFWAVGFAFSTLILKLPQYEDQLRRAYEGVQSAASGIGFSLPDPQEVTSGGLSSGMLSGAATQVGLKLQAFLTFFFLVLAFVVLGLTDMQGYEKKFGRMGRMAERIAEAMGEIGHKVRNYMGAISLSAAITGVASAVFAFAVGLEFALVFALLSFLMNYVPTIGSVIAIIPPTLFAFIQFDGLAMPLVVFAGFSLIELTVGNYVAPKIEGRILSITPTVVLLAIVFWGWLWGVMGALLAVPLTIAIALVCKHFPATRWVATFVSEPEG